MFNWNDFFDDWQRTYNVGIFALDGVTENSTYFDETIRVLFLLKDLHLGNRSDADEKNQVDMRKGCFDKSDWKTWNGIALWSKAWTEVISGGYEKIRDSVAFRKQYLPRIAFVNIKKEAGGPSVCIKEIKDYADTQKEKIIEEIKLLNPDVIVTCGTFDVAKIIFDYKESDIKKLELKNGGWRKKIRYFENGKKLEFDKTVYVVEYRHPCMASYEKCFNDMVSIRKYLNI